METSQPIKTQMLLPYIVGLVTAIVSFTGGFYVNYLSYTNKVDSLIDAVQKLTNIVETNSNRYTSLDKRVSKIEFYLFEYKLSTPQEKP